MKSLNRLILGSSVLALALGTSGCMTNGTDTTASSHDDTWCSNHPKQCDNKDWCAKNPTQCQGATGGN